MVKINCEDIISKNIDNEIIFYCESPAAIANNEVLFVKNHDPCYVFYIKTPGYLTLCTNRARIQSNNTRKINEVIHGVVSDMIYVIDMRPRTEAYNDIVKCSESISIENGSNIKLNFILSVKSFSYKVDEKRKGDLLDYFIKETMRSLNQSFSITFNSLLENEFNKYIQEYFEDTDSMSSYQEILEAISCIEKSYNVLLDRVYDSFMSDELLKFFDIKKEAFIIHISCTDEDSIRQKANVKPTIREQLDNDSLKVQAEIDLKEQKREAERQSQIADENTRGVIARSQISVDEDRKRMEIGLELQKKEKEDELELKKQESLFRIDEEHQRNIELIGFTRQIIMEIINTINKYIEANPGLGFDMMPYINQLTNQLEEINKLKMAKDSKSLESKDTDLRLQFEDSSIDIKQRQMEIKKD